MLEGLVPSQGSEGESILFWLPMAPETLGLLACTCIIQSLPGSLCGFPLCPWVLTPPLFYYKDTDPIHEDSTLLIQSPSKVLPPNIITLGVDFNI